MINNLGATNSVFNQFVAELRDSMIQKDSLRFRLNLERVSQIFAYEISKTLEYANKSIETPLGVADMMVPNETPVLATVMRAGLPMHQGFLQYFDKAENAFISALRKHHNNGSFTIKLEYLSSPSIDGKTLIIIDPLIGSGATVEMAYNAMLSKGNPLHTHIVTIIASQEGLKYLQKHLPMKNVTLWVGAIDDELTVKSFIVPGLGDAGNLAYGDKQ
jgi:uracil phosphoribosyltransferase